MITIAEIAEKCRVSKMTVSRALSDKHCDKVSEEVREQILRVARTHNYRRSRVAQYLNTGRTHLVGFIGSPLRHFESSVLNGVQSRLAGADYDVLFLQWTQELRTGDRLLESLVDRRVEGVLLFHHGPSVDYQYLLDLQKHGMPVVVVDRDVNVKGVHFVGPDNINGARQAVAHLAELGHRRLCFVSREEDAGLSSEAARYQGYRQAMQDAGLEPRARLVVPPEAIQPLCRHEWFHELLRKEQPTGIVANNDVVASFFLMTASRYGIRVPQDLSVVGFGNMTNYIQSFYPALTTVDQRPDEIGVKAAEVLLATIEARHKRGKTNGRVWRLTTPTELIVRESTGPCPPDSTPQAQ